MTEEHRDAHYFDHANAHINLSNSHLSEGNPAQVVASMIHATARFNTWVWAMTSASVEEMESRRAQGLELFLTESRRQFEEHFNDHVRNFDRVKGTQNDAGQAGQG